MLELGTRPKLLDQLLSNHQGRDFTLRLLLSTRAKSECDGSAFLCHCLREIVVTGHARELLQVQDLHLREDLHLFDAALVDISVRAKISIQGSEVSTLSRHAVTASSHVANDIFCVCGSCNEARCYALQFFRTLEADDIKDGFFWLSMRQEAGFACVPGRFVIGLQQLGLFVHDLVGASVKFVKQLSWVSLKELALAYSTRPCAALLRAPLVADRLFAVAFDSQLASKETIAIASFLIAVAGTVPMTHEENSSLAFCNSHWHEPSAMAADAASTAAAVSLCGQRCIEGRLLSHPNEIEASGFSRSNSLLILSLPCPAARHGVTFWLKRCLVNPGWLSTRLRQFAPTVITILQAYAMRPRSRRDVFEVLKLLTIASRRTEIENDQDSHELGDAHEATLSALANLASTWHGATEIFDFIVNTSSIEASKIRPIVVQIAHRAIPPYSLCFCQGVAALLSCRKGKQAWRNIHMLSYEDQYAIRNLASQIAGVLKERSVHYSYLSFLGSQ